MNHPETACEARESTLEAVRSDGITIAGHITDLEETVQRLHDHLMGQSPTKEPSGAKLEQAPPQGIIPQLCELGSQNINRLRRLQENVNQVCYLSGEGR